MSLPPKFISTIPDPWLDKIINTADPGPAFTISNIQLPDGSTVPGRGHWPVMSPLEEAMLDIDKSLEDKHKALSKEHVRRTLRHIRESTKEALDFSLFDSDYASTRDTLKRWLDLIQDTKIPDKINFPTASITTYRSLDQQYADILRKSHKTNGKRRHRRSIIGRRNFINVYVTGVDGIEEVADNKVSVTMSLSYDRADLL
jgi:hypothetical protein